LGKPSLNLPDKARGSTSLLNRARKPARRLDVIKEIVIPLLKLYHLTVINNNYIGISLWLRVNLFERMQMEKTASEEAPRNNFSILLSSCSSVIFVVLICEKSKTAPIKKLSSADLLMYTLLKTSIKLVTKSPLKSSER
jgi:hypothetical protein